MNTAAENQPLHQSILVWDLPTRVFHWMLAASFVIAYLTAESEAYALVHQVCGYLFVALIGFRLIWGLVGTRYARFSEFLRSPATIVRYLGGYFRGKPVQYIGHNPLGAIAILLMLALGIGIGITGWLNVSDMGGEAFEEIHEVFANAMLLVVFAHIAGVIASSVMHRENLVRAMVTGYKRGPIDAGIRGSRGIIATLMVVALGAFGWGLYQGKLPALLDPAAVNADRGEGGLDNGGKDDDDD